MEAPEPDEVPTPFSFKLMVVLLVIYLAYRIAQLVACLPAWFSSDACSFL